MQMYRDSGYEIYQDEDGVEIHKNGNLIETLAPGDLERYTEAVKERVAKSSPSTLREDAGGYFSYFGDTPIGDDWGIVYSKIINEGNTLVESNYECIREELEERYPDDYTVEAFSHFAVGSISHIMVRLLTPEGRISAAGIYCAQVWEELEQYPVLDEERWSQMEMDELEDHVRWEVREHDLTDEQVFDVISLLGERNITCLDEWDDDALDAAMDELGYAVAA